MEIEKIISYLQNNKVENAEVLNKFLLNEKNPYSRDTLSGHITGSAFSINEEKREALLILHKKYNKWVAPGGHVDAGENALQASERESGEEVGLTDLHLLSAEIFDIDIHRIPTATKNGKFEPEHWHFDVRYLYKISSKSKVNLNLLEANGFKWEKLHVLAEIQDDSISRQAQKGIKMLPDTTNKKG